MNLSFKIAHNLFVILLINILVAGTCFASVMMPYKQTFTTTAYYSPLPDQEHYVTGSYYGDIRLNGRGTNGASGAEVFPGMLAAPKSYPFGFKIDIPGIGISEVQDRGGAIVNAGERGESHDRLDVWMGAGEVGLERALLWGKRMVVATVYGVRPELAVTAGFEDWDGRELELVKYWKQHAPTGASSLVATLFPRDLWLGQESSKVAEMQTLLADLGYFFDDIDGHYDDATSRAVYHFQRDNDVVYDWTEIGAGHFGPHTRAVIEQAKVQFEEGVYVNQTAALEEIQVYDDLAEEFTAFTSELYLGTEGDGVRMLQEELIALGYLRTDATGHFGRVTENAVKRYQLKMGLVSSLDSHGAGVVGPLTRASLNGIFDQRIEAKSLIAAKRNENVDSAVLLASTEEITVDNVNIVEEVESAEEFIEEEPKVVEEVEPEPAYIPLTYGDTGSEVKELQRVLRDAGFFNSGFLTNYFGEKTQSALIAFQLENQLIASADDDAAGVLTQETQQKLFQ